jgi:uncharacterized protein
MIRREWIRNTVDSALSAHRSPFQIGSAIGVGVFLGCTPFFGFHTALALGASFLFRLNFVTVWLGTQISNPLFATGLTVTSIAVGSFLLHQTPQTFGHFSANWLAGSLLVGAALGAISGVLGGFVVRSIRNKRCAEEVPVSQR